MTSIITELVNIFLLASLSTPPGAGISRCIEDPLVAFDCCLLFGRVVVSLTHLPFPFSILYIELLCIASFGFYSIRVCIHSTHVCCIV